MIVSRTIIATVFFLAIGCDEPQSDSDPPMDDGNQSMDAGESDQSDFRPDLPFDVPGADLDDSSDVSVPASNDWVQVPSAAGGTAGIAVNIIAPASPGRFAEGAPIAIGVQGGWKATSVEAAKQDLADRGIVSIARVAAAIASGVISRATAIAATPTGTLAGSLRTPRSGPM